MQDSDESLMLGYRDGSADAFEALYQRHRGPLYRYLLRQGIRRQLVDELFQDIWLKVIKARQAYDVRARFTTWLYRIAYNRVVDEFRKNPKLALIDNGPDGAWLNNAPAADGDRPERRLEARRGIEELKRLIAALPREQRDAFLLREEAGLSVEQIAELTGASHEATKSRLRYAVAKLRKGLEAVL